MDNNKLSTNAIITIGITISLVAGFMDIIIGLTSEKSDFLLFRSILLPLALTTGFSFILFIVSWFILGKNISKWFKLNSLPLAVGIAVFITTSIVLFSLNNNSILISPLPSLILKLAIISAVAFVILLITYFAVKRIQTSEIRSKLGNSISFLLPLLLLELLIFIWLSKGNLSLFKASLGFLIIALLTGIVYFRFRGTYFRNVLALIYIVVLLGSPIGFFINAGIFAENFEESSNNKISNIILISIDTLRKDVLSSYGSNEVSTPNIDRIAEDGFLFTQAYSPAPWTLPAFSSIMTGVNPLVHKTTDSKSRLPETFTTIAEYLADSGYKTSAIGTNVFLHSEYNIDQGFMEYNFFPKRKELVDSFGGAFINIAFPGHFKTDASTSDLTDLSINWLNKNRDKDFFLWLHYYDPHIPYTPPVEYIAEDKNQSTIGNEFQSAGVIRSGHYSPNLADRIRIRQLYDAEVRYVDDSIGRLIETLEELDLYKDSLIIITSDHGEEFWEHGGFEHGHTLYNELINVPLIIKLPDNEHGNIIDIPVTTQSLMPTILELSDIEFDNGSYLASSLVPLLENKPSNYEVRPIISSSLLYYEDREAAIVDESKYIRTIITDQEEFYNLTKDPQEQSPLSNSQVSDKIFQAKDILKQHKDDSLELSGYYGVEKSDKVELDEEKKEKLRALDYIQ